VLAAGGRKNCATNDAVFRQAEGDLNNLVPAVGEVNADRSNLSYGAWAKQPTRIYGHVARWWILLASGYNRGGSGVLPASPCTCISAMV
jgi:hypothetical protein